MLLELEKLRSHIALRTQTQLHRRLVLIVESRKAEICQLDSNFVEIITRVFFVGLLVEDVIWLQITMGYLHSLV